MSRLNQIDPQACGGPIRNLLGGVIGRFGRAPNLMCILANSPAVLEGYLAFDDALAKGTLASRLRTLIALFVSAWNGCPYYLAVHTEQALKFGATPEIIDLARRGQGGDERTRAALQFTRALLEKQGGVDDGDLLRLRAGGFGDADIIEITAVTLLTSFTNTISHIALTEIDFPPVAPPDPH